MVRLRRARLCLAALFAVFFIAACSSDTSASGKRERADREPRPSDTTARLKWSEDEQAALDAYNSYLDVVDQALTAPLDPLAPELDKYATAEAAQDVRLRVSAFQQLGRAVRPETFFEPETITVDGSEATIIGCLSDFGIVYEVAAGTVLDDDRVQHIATTTLSLGENGSWRVTGSDAGRSEVPCDH